MFGTKGSEFFVGHRMSRVLGVVGNCDLNQCDVLP